MGDYSRVVAENLRNRRRALSLTQRELAERLGYSEKSVSKWESGAGAPPSELLPRLASVLESSIDSLFASGEAYYLGVDGGGTKTDFLLEDGDGRVLSRTRLSCSNPVDVGIDKTLSVLSDGIRKTLGEISPSRVSVYAGIAGLTVGDFSAQTETYLRELGFSASGVGSDATSAVAAGLGDRDGVAVILGTGTVAFLQRDGVQTRVGGYGYLLEQGLSGYALGRDALTEALKYEDGIGEASLLHRLFSERLSSERIFPLISRIYGEGKRGIASLAPTVFEAIDRGDGIALSLVTHLLAETAALIVSAHRLLGRDAPTVLVGGLTARRELLLPILSKMLPEPIASTLTVSERPPIEGALYLARKGKTPC